MSMVPATPSVELMPGDVAIGVAGDHFRTLLGSCVSILLTDPRRTVGAMCHIVYAGEPNADNVENTAYARIAMQTLFEKLSAMGISPQLCQAYVFGGGNMFPNLFNRRHVGDANADWALEFLEHNNITVLRQDLGGNGYRKVSWIIGYEEPVVETILEQHNGS